MYNSTSPMFKSLDDAEEREFRDYAKANRPPNMDSWAVYHPVCRAEWRKQGLMPKDETSANELHPANWR